MLRAAILAVVASLAAAAGWAACCIVRPPAIGQTPLAPSPPPVESDAKLSRLNFLDPVFVVGGSASREASRIEFEGKTFWLVDTHWGMGVPYKTIGLYAPDRDAKHVLVLATESCGAGHLKPEVDATTGMLVLREHANSTLKGQIILSCNLRSIGTYQSVHGE